MPRLDARSQAIPVRKIVVRLGGEGIAQADLLPWLDNWIEAAQRELGRQTNEDEAFEAARREAERRFKAGLESPSSALMDEFAREERAELERQEERKGRRLRLLEEAKVPTFASVMRAPMPLVMVRLPS